MKNKFLHLAPRILSILFVAFLCLFSLDGFTEFNGWQTILAVAMHLLIPAVVILGAIIAWEKDLVGAVIFFFFAVYYVFIVGFNRHWSWYAVISGPALIIGILYLLNWLQKTNGRRIK